MYSINFQDSKEAEKNLEQYKGKYILIVNVASKCGLTPQYEGLKQIQDSYEKDLQVIGFPCNQFMGQEPGTDEEIQTFCKTKYDVNFPVMKKIEVNGSNTHPLYEYLKSEKTGILTEAIKWNFTKFLVDRDGNVIKRYSPQTEPSEIEEELKDIIE
ncbi:MAG: glutathione peroxidase [Gammaproteobacteria bacterium]|nr:glutathione peroxidase [Gammaproteobacteria bacterium]